MAETEQLEGIVERILFESPDSDYVVFRIKRDDGGMTLTVTGNGVKPFVGDRLAVNGRTVTHKKYGDRKSVV